MLKLSTWSIVMCKRVCKTWRGMISDPQFAKLHFAQAKPCPLIRNDKQLRISRALYMLEPEDGGDFCTGHCWCDSSNRARNRSCHSLEVKSVLKTPLRNAQSFLSSVDDVGDAVYGVKGCNLQGFLKVKSNINNHIFTNISSCNGWLCLSYPHSQCLSIFNPITGEFINLTPPYNESCFIHTCFGFIAKSNQFKLLRVFDLMEEAAIVHTLGTNTWRSVGVVPLKWKLNFYVSPIHFDGAIYWFCSNDEKKNSGCLAVFDLEEERFQSSFQLPLGLDESFISVGMGVLGGRLCVYNTHCYPPNGGPIKIWAMEECGISKSWTRLVSIKISDSQFHPLSHSCDGAFLMFHYNQLIYCDKSGRMRFKNVKSQNASQFKAISHTPSFVSLKDMMDTSDMEVFNVYSGCGKIKLMEEARPVILECA